MPLTCPSCGSENADGARFCSTCGTPLTAGRKERKFATALFADLVGSTSLGEQEDPEVVQAVVGRAFDRFAAEIERYGGLLEKFMGDAVLAVFGVPTSHEDDPERAVRAALELQAILSELNRISAAEGTPQLSMRIGVEAGEVLVDAERATGPRDRMLTGDAVNTAARLQTAAEPGHAVVGPTVYAATKEVIDYRELPPLDLKGKAAPIAAWQALRVRARRRGERAALGLEARLIGRDEELAVLKQTLQRVASEERPALVTVLGNAGVGKSRLVWELEKYVEGLPEIVYWRKGRCLAYGNVSYSALADAVKAQCEVLEDDPPHVVGEKVDRAVEDLFGDLELAPHLRALVGAPVERSFAREELFDAWRRFLERLAARYPFVLDLEDIHWADDGLLSFIDHLADWAQGPIFILTLARPELLELRAGWGGGKRNYNALYLEPLTAAESQELVEDLLSTVLPKDLERLIVERSEGNPLFAEEIVRMFIDRGILRATDAARWEVALPVDEIEVPRSIQALIAARLDAIPAEEKAVLQDAAVVGRTFWVGAVARLGGLLPERARELLGRLRVKEIIVPREPPAFSGELEFAFRHLLIRDVAYDSLPKSLRAEKHDEVARWAEERAGERAEEIAEILADHYTQALSYLDELGGAPESAAKVAEHAYRWALAAAARSERLWLISVATGWLEEASALAERIGLPAPERADVLERLAVIGFQAMPYADVADAHLRAISLYEELGLERQAGEAEARLAMVRFQVGEDEAVLPLLERALTRLEPLGDSAELAVALHYLGWYRWRRGDLELAEEPLRRSVEMARRVNDSSILGLSTHSLGLRLVNLGRWREGLPLVEESFDIAKEIGDFALLARCYNNLPSTWMSCSPDDPRIEPVLLEGIELARKAGATLRWAWSEGSLGELRTRQGRLEEAVEMQRGALAAARERGEAPLLGMRLSSLSWTLLLQGKLDEARAALAEAEPILRDNLEPQSWIVVQRLLGELAATEGRLDDAVAHYLDGLGSLAGAEIHGDVEDTLAGLSQALMRLDRREEAMEHVRHLRAIADGRSHAEAFASWAEGGVADDPKAAAERLEDAAERFRALGWPVEEARVLTDLAEVERTLGRDPRPSLKRARDLFTASGANLFLPAVEEAPTESASRPASSPR